LPETVKEKGVREWAKETAKQRGRGEKREEVGATRQRSSKHTKKGKKQGTLKKGMKKYLGSQKGGQAARARKKHTRNLNEERGQRSISGGEGGIWRVIRKGTPKKRGQKHFGGTRGKV